MQNDKFEKYYSELYGSRWKQLRESLLEERPAFEYSHGLRAPYFLDYASVLAAQSLVSATQSPEHSAARETSSSCPEPLAQEHIILDACAAPGGKSLVIASALPESCILISNELSANRRRRLADVLDRHLDEAKRERVIITGFNAAAQGRRKSEHGRYAAILLDAPCSSESHLLKNAKALAQWTEARPAFLAQRQWSLLSSAFLLLKQGGTLVYATCALTTIENDGVVELLFKKYKSQAEINPPDFSIGVQTKFGRIILPDREGLGPLYVARLRKI